MKHPMLAKVLLAGLTGLSLTLSALAEDAPILTSAASTRRRRKGLSRGLRPLALGRPLFPFPAALRRHPPPHRL